MDASLPSTSPKRPKLNNSAEPQVLDGGASAREPQSQQMQASSLPGRSARQKKVLAADLDAPAPQPEPRPDAVPACSARGRLRFQQRFVKNLFAPPPVPLAAACAAAPGHAGGEQVPRTVLLGLGTPFVRSPAEAKARWRTLAFCLHNDKVGTGAPGEIVMRQFGMTVTRARAKDAFVAARDAHRWILQHPRPSDLQF